MRSAYQILVITPERKRQLRDWAKWEDNNKTNLKKIGCEDVDWSSLPEDGVQWRALMSTIMNIKVRLRARIS
jgi:hypothetical protein